MSVSFRKRKRELGPCRHYLETDYCGQPSVARYLQGDRCAQHTPSAMAGVQEPTPDPELTMEGIRKSKMKGG